MKLYYPPKRLQITVIHAASYIAELVTAINM